MEDAFHHLDKHSRHSGLGVSHLGVICCTQAIGTNEAMQLLDASMAQGNTEDQKTGAEPRQ